jgi:hypothetical protein
MSLIRVAKPGAEEETLYRPLYNGQIAKARKEMLTIEESAGAQNLPAFGRMADLDKFLLRIDPVSDVVYGRPTAPADFAFRQFCCIYFQCRAPKKNEQFFTS